MKLAFSTNAFKQTSLEQALAAIAAAGYDGAEIMADVPHALPADMPPQRIAALRRRLGELGLAVSNINAFTLFAEGDTYHPTWIESNPARVQRRIDHTRRTIDMAAELGAKTISLQPGGPMEDDARREEYLEMYWAGLQQVLPAARSAGITLAIEPEPGLLIESGAEYLDFMQRFAPAEPNLACNCDVGHLFCVGEDPAAMIRRLGRHVAHVHLEDIAASRVHQHLPLGQGAMDLPAIFAALDAIGYAGFVTVELYPYVSTAEEVARAAREHLRKLV